MNKPNSVQTCGAAMRWMTCFLGCALVVGCGSAVEDEQDTDDGSSGMVGSSSSGPLPSTSSSGSTSIDESTTGSSTSDTTTGLDTSSGPQDTGVMETGSTDTGSTESSSGGDDTTTGVVDTAEYDYLFALSAIVAPGTPFQFVGTIDADDTTVEIALTPLSLDVGAVDVPREPVPPTLVWTGDVTEGVFSIDLPMLELLGPTNPITGSDIEASIQIIGQFEGDNLCAAVTGQVTSPANIDLAGSTFSAMPLDLGPSPEPEELPLPSAIVCP